MTAPTTLERAFALARSGTCLSVQDIRMKLKQERFDNVEAHLSGHSITRQLRALCEEARDAQRATPAAPAEPAPHPSGPAQNR